MLEQLKNKFPCHRRKKAQAQAQGEPKPNNKDASGVVGPEKQDNSIKPVERPAEKPVEKPQPAQTSPPAQSIHQQTDASREANAPTPDVPQRDLWQDAFKSLPEGKQQILKKMGFNKPNSGSVKSDISDLVGEVNKRQEECEKKFWRVNVGGEDIVLRNYTTKIVGWLEKAGDIAVQFSPPQASIPWQVMKGLMQIPVVEGEMMAALLGTTEKVVQIITRGQVYESVYLSQAGTSDYALAGQLQACLLGIYTASLNLLADSGDMFSKNTAQRTILALINPNKASGGLSDIAEKEEELLRNVAACETRRSAAADDRIIGMLDTLNAPIARMDEGVGRLVEHMDEENRIKMLEFISRVPFGKHHDNVAGKRTPGTGQWLLRHSGFRNWTQERSSSIFLLQGTAGTGKTYLTSTIIDFMRNLLTMPPKDEGFAFFYCEKTDPRRSEPLSILQSFVRQLATTAGNPDLPLKRLQDVYKSNQKNGSTFTFDQCRMEILACLNAYQKTTLVIDAIDECSVESRDEFIEVLNQFVIESQNPVKIFISTRPDPDVQRQLENAPSLTVSADENKEDITNYLDGAVDKLAKKAGFFREIKSNIVKTLVDQCQGMFQWAALQVHQIAKCRTKPSVWKRLKNLPEDLEKAYDEIFAEIEGFEEPDRSLAKRALQWVMCASYPLTSKILLSAIRVTVDSADGSFSLEDELDEQALLSLCNNFLIKDTEFEVWRFPHLSVREYLESKKQLTLPRAHCQAAIVSLSLLNNPKEIELDSDGYPKETEPVEDYVNEEWPKHLHGAQELERDMLSTLLRSFLGSPGKSTPQYKRWADKAVLCQKDLGAWISAEFQPAEYPVFAMSYFGLDDILSDWWETAEFDISLRNYNSHNLLVLAAYSGSILICKNLVARGVEINFRCPGGDDPTYGSPLVAAAHQGHTEIVKFLVDSGAEVNMSLAEEESLFGSALTAAIVSSNVETVKYLLGVGADVNMPFVRDPYDEHERFGSPLGRAASIANIKILECLLNAGADVNVPIRIREGSALAIAAREGNLGNVKYLVENGKTDVNMRIWPSGSALGVAASAGELEIVKYLVNSGAEVNMQTTGNMTDGSALAGAVDAWIEGGPGIAKYLVDEAGADVNLPLLNGNYGSVLAKAVSSGTAEGQLDLANYLLKAGADVNMSLQYGKSGSALAAAAGSGYDVEIVELLLSAGADVNKPLATGCYGNALIAAASGDNLDIVKCIMNAGAEVNSPAQIGDYGSALAAAAAGANLEMVKYLLEAGAEVNLKLPAGKYGSALAAAAIGFDVEIVKCLLERGADVNMSLSTGEYGSALAAAVSKKNMDLVKTMLKAGADVNLPLPTDQQGNVIVAAGQSLEIVQFLLEAGADHQMLCHEVFLVNLAEADAEWKEKLPLFEKAVDAGADLNKQVQGGSHGSVLIAAARGDSVDQVKFLIEAGADPNLQILYDEYGFGSALAGAANNGQGPEIAKCLVEGGADVNLPLENGHYGSALAHASSCYSPELQAYLVEAGANVNMPLKDRDFGSALAAAAAFAPHNCMVEYLIEQGADVNTGSIGKYGNALSAASAWGRDYQVETLLKAGADVNIKLDGSLFATALQAAQSDVLPEDKAWIKLQTYSEDSEIFEAESLKARRANVAKLLQAHGATA